MDVSVMLGASEQAAEAQMKSVLDFEMKLAQVNWGQNSFGSQKDKHSPAIVLDVSMERVLVCVDTDPL